MRVDIWKLSVYRQVLIEAIVVDKSPLGRIYGVREEGQRQNCEMPAFEVHVEEEEL